MSVHCIQDRREFHCTIGKIRVALDAPDAPRVWCLVCSVLLQGGAQQGLNPGQGLPEILDTGQAGAAGLGKGFASPLRLDRLAMFHDIVTSPEVRLIMQCRSICRSQYLPQRLQQKVMGLWLHRADFQPQQKISALSCMTPLTWGICA